MLGYAGGRDWINAPAMKYWAFPASYSQEQRKNELNNLIYSGDYIGARKVDGYYESGGRRAPLRGWRLRQEVRRAGAPARRWRCPLPGVRRGS